MAFARRSSVRARWALLAVALGTAACEALFGEPVQCSTDQDCARLGGACVDGFCTSPRSAPLPSDSNVASEGAGRTPAPESEETPLPAEAAAPVVDAGSVPAAKITMGEADVLGIDDFGNANRLLAQEATLAQTATLTHLSFYVAAASGKLRLGLYDATGPGGGPGAKKAETTEFTAAAGFVAVPVTAPVVLAPGKYWLAFATENNTLRYRRAGDGAGTLVFFTQPYGAMPATFSATPTQLRDHWSFYATLVP